MMANPEFVKLVRPDPIIRADAVANVAFNRRDPERMRRFLEDFGFRRMLRPSRQYPSPQDAGQYDGAQHHAAKSALQDGTLGAAASRLCARGAMVHETLRLDSDRRAMFGRWAPGARLFPSGPRWRTGRPSQSRLVVRTGGEAASRLLLDSRPRVRWPGAPVPACGRLESLLGNRPAHPRKSSF